MKILTFCLIVILYFTCQPIHAESRTALVIGNAEYKVGRLRNPVNDAKDISAALKKTGFDVMLLENANQRQMDDAIRKFGKKLKKGGVGLFYYAGHGMQVNGINYLIPTGARITEENDIKYESVETSKILAKMESASNKLNIIILDACRDNPFARSFRSSSRGLAVMDAPAGSLIAYATSPGSVAADGPGRNGIFTKHLLHYIQRPNLEILSMLRKVKKSVVEETDFKQVPWDANSLTESFYFMSGKTKIKQTFDEESEYWATIRDSNNTLEFERYLEKYPEGKYREVAFAKIRIIKEKAKRRIKINTYPRNVDSIKLFFKSGAFDKKEVEYSPDALYPQGKYLIVVKKRGYDTRKEPIELTNEDVNSTIVLIQKQPSFIEGAYNNFEFKTPNYVAISGRAAIFINDINIGYIGEKHNAGITYGNNEWHDGPYTSLSIYYNWKFRQRASWGTNTLFFGLNKDSFKGEECKYYDDRGDVDYEYTIDLVTASMGAGAIYLNKKNLTLSIVILELQYELSRSSQYSINDSNHSSELQSEAKKHIEESLQNRYSTMVRKLYGISFGWRF